MNLGTSHGDWLVDTYFHKLCGMWQELDNFQKFKAKSAPMLQISQKFIEDGHIYEFLGGLWSEYDHEEIKGMHNKNLNFSSWDK